MDLRNFLDKVKCNFNRASDSYDSVAIVQKESARLLVDELSKISDFSPRTILDLGAGTGYVTELLLDLYPECSYLLNDVADKMIDICRSKFSAYPNISFLVGDMVEIDVGKYELVISNLAIQWTRDLLHTIKILHTRASKAFLFSTVLDGTFQEWRDIVEKYKNIEEIERSKIKYNDYGDENLLYSQKYPSEEELVKYCKEISDKFQFKYWTMDMDLNFADSLELARYLKALGASTSNEQMSFAAFANLLANEQGPIKLNYKIFFGAFLSNDISSL